MVKIVATRSTFVTTNSPKCFCGWAQIRLEEFTQTASQLGRETSHAQPLLDALQRLTSQRLWRLNKL